MYQGKLKDQLLVSPLSVTNAKCSQYLCEKEFGKIDDLKKHYKDVIKKFPSKTNAVCVGLVVTTTSLKRRCNLIFIATDAETAGQFEMEELMPRLPREYNDDVTFIFKPYDRGKKDNLRYVGRLFAKGIRKLYSSDQEIELYEAIPLPELQGFKTLKVAFHQTTKDEHRDVCGAWEQYLGLEDSDGAPKRTHAAHQVVHLQSLDKLLIYCTMKYWTFLYQNFKISEEEKHLGTHHRLVHVYHFNWEAAQNQMNGTLAVLKLRIQKKLQVPDEEFAKWTFAFLLLGHPEYLEDLDILSSHFQGVSVAWEQYLGLDHSDGAPKRTPAAHQVELSHPDAELRLLEVFYYRTYKNRNLHEKPVNVYN